MTLLSLIAPEAMMSEVEHLAMALARGEADRDTFLTATWQDAAGQLYAVAAKPQTTLAQDPTLPLERPTWDMSGGIDMDRVKSMQNVLVFCDTEASESLPNPNVGGILALRGGDPLTLLASVGLALVPQPL